MIYRTPICLGQSLATACLLVGFVCFYKNIPAGDQQTTMPPVAAVAGPRYVTSNIEDLRVGDWVLARNPEISDEQRAEAEGADGEAEAGQWWTVSLRMTKADGGRLNVTLLRPVEWLEECSAKPGKTIDLDLPELGAAGPAEVVSIDPCPEIDAAPSPDCQLVTGTFAHESAEVIDLKIDGLDAPIGVTGNHPFWSEDRHSFVPAGQLKVGERLASANGTLKRVVSLASRVGCQPVYNLEVNFEHAYYVSNAGVLVHNECFRKPTNAGSRVGSYTIKFAKGGMKYHGKGPWSRALESARRIGAKYGNKATKIDWKPARGSSSSQAFIDEAKRIRADRGVGNPKNYNQRNSPGEKYLPKGPR